MFSFESVRNGGSGGGRGNVQASLWNSVVDSWAGWYEQKELSIPCTEFWDTRGQVAVLNHQWQGRCKFYNGQQDHSSNPGALTLRDLWDDWDHIVLSTDDRGYVTCITTTKKSVLPSGRLMSASKMESYSFFLIQVPDVWQCTDPKSIDWRKYWIPLRKDTAIPLL